MNIVHISSNKKKHYLIVARDDFFEWAETRVLSKAKAWRVTKFLWKNVICKHDYFEKLIVNDEFENKEIFNELMQRYRIKKMITLNYHSQINEMIKKDHRFLSEVLFKMSDEELKSWIDNLHVVLWANRFIVKFIIDLISFYLQCDSKSMFLIELKIFIWRILSWSKIHIIEDFLITKIAKKKWKHEQSKKIIKMNAKTKKKIFRFKTFRDK